MKLVKMVVHIRIAKPRSIYLQSILDLNGSYTGKMSYMHHARRDRLDPP
jgi:hypothetical protein